MLAQHEEVQFTFENRSDALLCLYSSEKAASSGGCLVEVKPKDNDQGWTLGCGDGPGVETNPITVVIVVREEGRQIYGRTEECQVWQDSDRMFIIEQRGDEFVVADPL